MARFSFLSLIGVAAVTVAAVANPFAPHCTLGDPYIKDVKSLVAPSNKLESIATSANSLPDLLPCLLQVNALIAGLSTCKNDCQSCGGKNLSFGDSKEVLDILKDIQKSVNAAMGGLSKNTKLFTSNALIKDQFVKLICKVKDSVRDYHDAHHTIADPAHVSQCDAVGSSIVNKINGLVGQVGEKCA